MSETHRNTMHGPHITSRDCPCKPAVTTEQPKRSTTGGYGRHQGYRKPNTIVTHQPFPQEES